MPALCSASPAAAPPIPPPTIPMCANVLSMRRVLPGLLRRLLRGFFGVDANGLQHPLIARKFGFSSRQPALLQHVRHKLGADFSAQCSGICERHVAMNTLENVIECRAVELPQKLAPAQRRSLHQIALELVA